MNYSHIMLICMISITSQALASSYSGNNPSGTPGYFGDKGKAGVFCMVEDVKVCVIARDAEDCKLIGGKNVITCNTPE